MRLSELILKAGDENVLVEPLNDFLVSAKGKPDHTIMTVRTGVMTATDWLSNECEYVGLMVWIPKSACKQ